MSGTMDFLTQSDGTEPVPPVATSHQWRDDLRVVPFTIGTVFDQDNSCRLAGFGISRLRPSTSSGLRSK